MIYQIEAIHPSHATLSGTSQRRININYNDVVDYKIINKDTAILKPAKFAATSHIRIIRARLDTPGAQGLRAGFMDGMQNAGRITNLIDDLGGPIFYRFYFDVQRFNEWFDVDETIFVSGNELGALQFKTEFWNTNYDALGIAEKYIGAAFSFRSVLEIETSGVPIT